MISPVAFKLVQNLRKAGLEAALSMLCDKKQCLSCLMRILAICRI